MRSSEAPRTGGHPATAPGGLLAALLLLLCGACSSFGSGAPTSPGPAASPAAPGARPQTGAYLYAFPDGHIVVYDLSHGFRELSDSAVPTGAGVRGVGAVAGTGSLYISYGGDGGQNGDGHLLKYDLATARVVWRRDYDFGIDSFDIGRDGTRIYMPTGELADSDVWQVLDATDGHVIAAIHGGQGPHNTAVGLSGDHVYLAGRFADHLAVADTRTDQVVRQIGPLISGVRPFTLDARERYAFTTATGFLGFQVSDIASGRVLYTVPVGGVPAATTRAGISAPAHGISLSPDEREIWLIDSTNDEVHVFDVTGLPQRAPRQVADVRLHDSMRGDERGCAYDCARDGWLSHSRDGRLVFVGDSGDVIDTGSRTVVGELPALANTRKFIEIDYRNGRPAFATPREGLGYAGASAPA